MAHKTSPEALTGMDVTEAQEIGQIAIQCLNPERYEHIKRALATEGTHPRPKLRAMHFEDGTPSAETVNTVLRINSLAVLQQLVPDHESELEATGFAASIKGLGAGQQRDIHLTIGEAMTALESTLPAPTSTAGRLAKI